MKHKQIAIRILCALVLVFIFVGTIIDFSLQLQQGLKKETFRILTDVSEDYNKAVADRITCNIETLEVLAGGLTQMQGRPKQDIMHILQNAVDRVGFAKIIISDTAGNSCSNQGTVENISHCNYFQKAMEGTTDISDPVFSSINGEDVVVISVPIGSKNQMTGAVFGVYPLYSTENQLLDMKYYNTGYGFIAASDGTIVLASEHTDKLCREENILSFFEKTGLCHISLPQMKAAMKNKESGNFAFTYGGEKRFVHFAPARINDWVSFTVSSDAMMQRQEKAANKMVLRLTLRMLLAGSILFIWVVLIHRQRNKAISKESQKYQSLLSHINGGLMVETHGTSAKDTITTYVSPQFTAMTGYTLEDIQNLGHDVIFEEDREKVFQEYDTQLTQGKTYHLAYRIRKKDGSLLWVMENGYLVEEADGLYNHSIITDITVLRQQEEALRLSENRFSVAINASSGTLFEVDMERKMYTHFENPQRIFGVDAEKLLADTRGFSTLSDDEFIAEVTSFFFHPDDRQAAEREMQELVENKTTSYEARLRRFDQSYIWCRVDLSLTLNEFGKPYRLVGFITDIDDIKTQAILCELQAQKDSMTDLYNKAAMVSRSNQCLEDNPTGKHALMILDIDNFKGINDSLGHAFGDLVLIDIAAKLKTAFRDDDIVGRIGGDEFAVLMKNVSNTSNVLKKGTELSEVFRQNYAGENGNYKISCSIGIIMVDKSGDTFETAYQKADAALYQAKKNGKDQFILYQEGDAASYPIEQIKPSEEERQNLRKSYSLETQIFELLYTSKDFDVSVNMALAAIGQEYHVNRVTVFENDEDGLTTGAIYEWCNNGICSNIAHMQNWQLSSGTESIYDSFDHNDLLYCSDVRDLPPYLRESLKARQVRSTLKVLIRNDEKVCGLIGFDECEEYRVWTSEEISKLSFLSKVLSVFLFKKKTEVALWDNLQTRLKILDLLPDYICVVNPETHVIEYTNRKMQELIPGAEPGAFCFMTLRSQQSGPCKTCLVERINQGETENLEISSADGQLHLKVDFSFINWDKNQRMLLLFGTDDATKKP